MPSATLNNSPKQNTVKVRATDVLGGSPEFDSEKDQKPTSESADRFLRSLPVRGEILFNSAPAPEDKTFSSFEAMFAAMPFVPTKVDSYVDIAKDAGAKVLGTTGNATKDVFNEGWDLLKTAVGASEVTPAPKTQQEAEAEEKKKAENMIAQAQINKTQQEIDGFHNMRDALPHQKAQIEIIAKKVGLSADFTDLKDKNGGIRLDILTAVDQVDAEDARAQRAATKATAIHHATPGAKRVNGATVNMNTTMEDQNMNRPG